ncbi:MAG: hypothetical protein AB7T22_11670 [Calditrichaceae bacterium]
MSKKTILLIIVILQIITAGCSRDGVISRKGSVAPAKGVPVFILPLSEELTGDDIEISGLAWFNNYLIILPQYPERFQSDGNGMIFAIPKAEILERLESGDNKPLDAIKIPVFAKGLNKKIAGFEGFEAIAFRDSTAYLTIESKENRKMKGQIVTGAMKSDLSGLYIQSDNIKDIPSDVNLRNMAFESLVITNNGVMAIYEANGVNVNHSPYAVLFDFSLNLSKRITFPAVEYRITDATCADSGNRFWVINYFFPGDAKLLNPPESSIHKIKGEKSSKFANSAVERIIELQYSDSIISATNRETINLFPASGSDSRNWEGIVLLENKGFIMATDKFPVTILAFVPFDNIQNDGN